MANLAAADVTILASWSTGGTNGKRNKVRHVKWTDTTAGGATNLLTATALGFRKILKCSSILLDASTKKIYAAVPAADGSAIYASENTSDADIADIATSTDYAYCVIEGV